MNPLPNPFASVAPDTRTTDKAAASMDWPPPDAAADRFVLDERTFLEALEEMPAFLSAPSPEYLQAADMIPMLAVLAGH